MVGSPLEVLYCEEVAGLSWPTVHQVSLSKKQEGTDHSKFGKNKIFLSQGEICFRLLEGEGFPTGQRMIAL